jgi:hypothetical protein
MDRAALAHCPLPVDPVCALNCAQTPACRPVVPPISHGRAGIRLWACGVHACEFTVFGERVSRPAVPVRVPHGGGGPAAVFLHTFCRHRPASRAEAAVSRTWLPAEVSRELRSDGAHTRTVHEQTTFFAKCSRTILRAPRINPSSTHWCSSGRCVQGDGVNTILTPCIMEARGVCSALQSTDLHVSLSKNESCQPQENVSAPRRWATDVSLEL